MSERDAGEPPTVLAVVGTRPEVIKMAPVVRALERRASSVDVRLALTGQHTDLVEQALRTFGLTPDHDLALMRPDQSLYDVARGCLDGLREIVRQVGPDVVLVQGDTATVFFGALVSFFERLRVGHVEAGLRSGDKWAPYPEEIFRRLTDVVADFLFAPTPRAAANLRNEGVPADAIHVTGNTVVDAVRAVAREADRPRSEVLGELLSGDRPFVLLTAHRRESFGEPLRHVFRAVRDLVEAVPEIELLYPVHPNPNVTEPAREILGGRPRVHLVPPLDYPDLVRALREARLVLTDSGGIQEEAPSFGTPVLVLREVTERPEGVEAGAAQLVGTDRERVFSVARRLLEEPAEREATAGVPGPYGDGRAGERIADVLIAALTGEERRTRDWGGP